MHSRNFLAEKLTALQRSLCSDVRCAPTFAACQRSLRANVRCAHSFAFGCAIRSDKSVYELIICVEIRISDDICTMDPTFVYMLVKSKNQYTGNFGFSLKTADFYEILVHLYRFCDFRCVKFFQLHIILHISNADCAGFFARTE